MADISNTTSINQFIVANIVSKTTLDQVVVADIVSSVISSNNIALIAFASGVMIFSIDDDNAETTYATRLRELKRWTMDPESEPFSKVLESLSKILGDKILVLGSDPRRQKFEAIFERIMFGVDFEYKVREFARLVVIYKHRGDFEGRNRAYITSQLDEIVTDLKIKSTILCRHGKEDIMAIVPVIRTTMKRLTVLCKNNILATQLENFFVSEFNQYEVECRWMESKCIREHIREYIKIEDFKLIEPE